MNSVNFCTQFVQYLYEWNLYGQINPESDKRQDKFVFQLGDMAVFDTLDPIRQAIHFCLFSKTNTNCCYSPLNWMLRYPRLPYLLPPIPLLYFRQVIPLKYHHMNLFPVERILLSKVFFSSR